MVGSDIVREVTYASSSVLLASAGLDLPFFLAFAISAIENTFLAFVTFDDYRRKNETMISNNVSLRKSNQKHYIP